MQDTRFLCDFVQCVSVGAPQTVLMEIPALSRALLVNSIFWPLIMSVLLASHWITFVLTGHVGASKFHLMAFSFDVTWKRMKAAGIFLVGSLLMAWRWASGGRWG